MRRRLYQFEHGVVQRWRRHWVGVSAVDALVAGCIYILLLLLLLMLLWWRL
jgi:hypothetical protein